MSVPDYISPIVGYRVWQWDAAGLKSLNGEPWLPGRPLTAGCRAAARGTIVGRAEALNDAHEPPHSDCTCGVYATKNIGHLRTTGYERYGIHGEVYLWGTVVEHKLGWCAQFAYPKSLVLRPDLIPFRLGEVGSRLETLVAYGIRIFVADANRNIPLWTKHSGLNPTGLDYIIEIGKEYYVRRQLERTLKKGDRVAVIGRGIAVVEHVNGKWIQAVVLNKCLRIARKCILWDGQNMRWETSPHACAEANGKA